MLYHFGRRFVCDTFILGIIESGYKLPFTDSPPSSFSNNNRSALDNNDFVESSISELLKSGCVRELDSPPFIVNPLSVSIKTPGRNRLILDLRKVNLFLAKYKFRLKDIKNLKEMLKPDDYMFTFDLKSGYHHVDIHEAYQKYLGFSWKFGDVVKYLFLLSFLLVCPLPRIFSLSY